MTKNKLFLMHSPTVPYQLVLRDGTVKILLISNSDLCFSNLKCLWSDPSENRCFTIEEKRFSPNFSPMEYCGSAGGRWYYSAALKMQGSRLVYYFTLEMPEGLYSFDERGLFPYSEDDQERVRGFFVDWSFREERFFIDERMKELVWYQIFPDRFCSSLKSSEGYPEMDEENRTTYSFHGNLEGIRKALPYIKKLGADGIYLNPIFLASSIHKYDAVDYGKIDPWFGSEDDFKNLVNDIHAYGMKIMLDGVFNHVSDKFPPFLDVLKNGKASPWKDWFIERSLSSKKLAEKFSGVIGHNYETFCFVPSMPKLNTRNPEVQKYLIDKALYWTKKYFIDAWRLDVPDEISTEFLIKFRKEMRKASPFLYIIGEIWSSPFRWLSGNMFDGVMNYTLYFIIRDFFIGHDSADMLISRLGTYAYGFPLEIQQGMFNMTGNHDVPRMISLVGGSIAKSGSAFLLTAMMPGNLNVYYGDELFMKGQADPYNRRVFPWNEANDIDKNRRFIRDVINFYHAMDRTELRYNGAIRKEDLIEFSFVGKEEYCAYLNVGASEKVLDGEIVITNGIKDESGRTILRPWESAVRRLK